MEQAVKKIVVFNAKGGSGKTTLSTNLASYYASQGLVVAIKDYDPQGSSAHWVTRRSDNMPSVKCIEAFKKTTNTTTAWQNRVDEDVEVLIVDFPAGANPVDYQSTLNDAHAIIVPVLPSEIDIAALKRSIANLLLRARLDHRQKRIAVVANRVRENTLIYQRLQLFLHSLDIPFVAHIKDAQCYVQAFEQGVGLFELPDDKSLKQHKDSWSSLLMWIESRGLEPELELSE